MLITNPRRIYHRELQILARKAKGSIKHIYLRWDLLALSGLPVTKNLRPGGYLLREKALEYSKLFEHSKVLELPQPQKLELLAA